MSMTGNLEDSLFSSEKDQYGDRYVEHLLEQYKIYVNSAERVSDRRLETNKFFLGINTALVTVLGFIAAHEKFAVVLILSSLGGISICYLWYRIIVAYKGLNSGKFKVIHAIETRLPLAIYGTEWEALDRGESKEKYWPFTHIELWVPRIFILIYFFTICFAIYLVLNR